MLNDIKGLIFIAAIAHALPKGMESAQNAKVCIPDSEFAVDQAGNIVHIGSAGASAGFDGGAVQPFGQQQPDPAAVVNALQPTVPVAAQATPQPAQVLEPVHRFFDSFSHFYTKNRNEIFDSRFRGMQYEGVAFCVWNQPPDADSVAVLRYERDHGSEKKFDRFLTVDPAEIGTTVVGEIGRHNFKFIENLGYVSKVPKLGLSAIYRYYHDAGAHFYTKNPNEIGISVAGQRNGPWSCEGVIGYAKPSC